MNVVSQVEDDGVTGQLIFFLGNFFLRAIYFPCRLDVEKTRVLLCRTFLVLRPRTRVRLIQTVLVSHRFLGPDGVPPLLLPAGPGSLHEHDAPRPSYAYLPGTGSARAPSTGILAEGILAAPAPTGLAAPPLPTAAAERTSSRQEQAVAATADHHRHGPPSRQVSVQQSERGQDSEDEHSDCSRTGPPSTSRRGRDACSFKLLVKTRRDEMSGISGAGAEAARDVDESLERELKIHWGGTGEAKKLTQLSELSSIRPEEQSEFLSRDLFSGGSGGGGGAGTNESYNVGNSGNSGKLEKSAAGVEETQYGGDSGNGDGVDRVETINLHGEALGRTASGGGSSPTGGGGEFLPADRGAVLG